MRFLLIQSALLLAALAARPALACECLWEGSFAEVAPHADLAVAGTVIAQRGNAIDLRIERQLLGEVYLDTVRVWGRTDDLCRPDADEFPVGSQWVMALTRIDNVPADGFSPSTPNVSFGRPGDYALSNCGAYWLTLDSGQVSGHLLAGSRWDYEGEPMNPVLVELIGAYLQGVIPREALEEAARPLTETRKLMNATREFLRQQEHLPPPPSQPDNP
ncbi:MAG: delta-aminolevulinic acid dehydratase [Spongiibacteraceae bacterium]|jgi:hypothetical protein|nr:delta-aminolevulinic acid dehydratase [Spongiibacteraceae bacterium]